MSKLGFITDLNSIDLKKNRWTRASRTDKGVHAVANYISCKWSISKEYINFPEGKNNLNLI